MDSLETLGSVRDRFKFFLLTWLNQYMPGIAELAYTIFVICWITVFAFTLHVIITFFIRRILASITFKNDGRFYETLLESKLLYRLSYIIQGFIVHSQARVWLDENSFVLQVVGNVTNQWVLIFGLLAFYSILNAFEMSMKKRGNHMRFPFRGLIQTIKLVACLLAGLLAISILLGKSPLLLLSGLGALSAILLLVFKDPILGFVAGIQLSANEMLAVGDWLEMPKYDADGDVIDIALTTVKVRNWDKTITTIPTYALISDSFKNWRGMTDAGGRRIKRSVLIDTSTVKFLDQALLNHLKKAELLDQYLNERLQIIERANEKRQINNKNLDMSVRINGRRLTNLGTFRAYLLSYLQDHPGIHQGMTLMIRQLDPSENGLPIEIYAFTNTTSWYQYEDIQADIFDHIYATLSEFGLRAHESPTGYDMRALSQQSSKH